MNIFWSALDLSEKVELCTGPLDKHNKYDCLMGHSHSESNCNLHNTWLHISPSLKGTSLQKKYLPITPPDDLLFSSIYSAKPSLVSCVFYHFKLELAQLLRFNYLSTSYLFKRLFLRSLQPLYDLFYLSSYFSNSSYFHWNSPSFGTDLLIPFHCFSIFGWNFSPTFEWFWIHQHSLNLSQPFCID